MESFWSMVGESSYFGLLVDTTVNTTEFVNSFSTEVPDSLFVLPFELISLEEFELMVNETIIV